MACSRRGLLPRGALLGAGFLAALVLGPVRSACADDVSPKGKGIAGGALLGAESVTIVASLAGLRAPWIYGVGAAAGAIGGGVGGYFVEHSSADGTVPTYMLAGGLALVIPALVLYLNGTRYQPEEGATDDRAPSGPPAEPGVPGVGVTTAPTSSAPAPTTPPPAPSPASVPPLSLFDVKGGAPRMGVPVPELHRTLTVSEERLYGTHAAGELRVPVLHVAF